MNIKKLSVIIPAYNEEKTVGKVIEMILNLDLGEREKEIIVINDGSSDCTGEVVDSFRDRCRIIHHPKNQGKGAAMRTGLEWASGDYLIAQDADLELDLNDIGRLVEKAEKEDAMVVYGSRVTGAYCRKDIDRFYFFGGKVITFLTNLLFNTNITDEPTCYKLINRELMKKIGIDSSGFEFCPEITAKIARSGNQIYEIPISYFPRDKKNGKKLRWFKDGWRAVWTLLKYRFRK